MSKKDESRYRPNIVLIMADDLGFSDLGCYGGEIRTPNIDGLARDGVRFTRFYNNAVCIATRASLLTGLYCHQVGEGRWGNSLPAGGNNVTFAEAMKPAGYRTLMAGKWHNGHETGSTPVDRGFDRYWGLLSGATNYFNPGEERSGEPAPVHKFPNDFRHWGDDDKVMFPFTPEDRKFYATDAFTDRALGFLDQYGSEEDPFLLYLAFTAPHCPVQAWPEDIARYQGRYMIGWDELRRQRHERMVDMGLVEKGWNLSEREDMCPPWEDVDDKERWDRRMAVYAAMVDRMDQGIGRVLNKIRELGKEEDTLVIFLSDNGGCGAIIDHTPDKMPGALDTHTTVDPPWANASNTPFRMYKMFDHEGGISTPMIARWPGVIQPGAITHQMGHVIDFLPTFLELGQADYPSHFNGHDVLPPEGRSLMPVLQGDVREEPETLFWELSGCRAVRKGRWKAVSLGPERRHQTHFPIPAGRDGWELYDMEQDRCELNDVSGGNPDVVEDLDALWRKWFERCQNDKEGNSRRV